MLKDVIFVWLEKIFYFFIFLSQVSQNTQKWPAKLSSICF